MIFTVLLLAGGVLFSPLWGHFIYKKTESEATGFFSGVALFLLCLACLIGIL